jgi:hypothetical protein
VVETTLAVEAFDLSDILPLVAAVTDNAKFGNPGLTLKDVATRSPRSDLDRYSDAGGVVVVGLPFEDGCAWFVGGGDGRIAMGSSEDRNCDPAGAVPFLSDDGDGLRWAAEALHYIDGIARDVADLVLLKSKTAILVEGVTPSAEQFGAMLAGLTFVPSDQPSTGAFEVSFGASGSDVAIAVRGQSGTCYLVAATITSQADIRFGTGDSCTANDAATAATHPTWPA